MKVNWVLGEATGQKLSLVPPQEEETWQTFGQLGDDLELAHSGETI